jgi:hypothetical protein
VKGLAKFMTALVPAGNVAVVHGFPDSEESSLGTVLELSNRYSGRTVLLCDNIAESRAALATAGRVHPGSRPERIEFCRKSTPKGLLLFVRAELVFHTHGLFGSPKPLGRRVHVYMTHGTGPKRTFNQAAHKAVQSDFIVLNSVAWGDAQAEELGFGSASSLYAPYARETALRVPASDEVLHALGIDPARPYVLWLPTYRASTSIAAVRTLDGSPLENEDTTLSRVTFAGLASALQREGIQVLIKPHPLHADDLESLGVPSISSEQIQRAGATVYQLIGRSRGVITDYSSVLTEVLAAGITLGLYCPDYEEYLVTRGLYAPLLRDVLGKLMLESEAQVEEFCRAVAQGRIFELTACIRAQHDLGLLPRHGSSRTPDLLSAVREACTRRSSTTAIAARLSQRSNQEFATPQS